MDTITQICLLLEQKKNKFLEYEQATMEMLHCDADDIEEYITKRGILANEIDGISEEIGRVCNQEPNGQLYFQAAAAAVNFDEILPEMHPIYELGQQTRSVVARIMNSDKQVVERLELLKAEALAKIKENQNLPKIKKYLSDLGDTAENGQFTSGKA